MREEMNESFQGFREADLTTHKENFFYTLKNF